jgi:ligand-binding sensor domain-containing protein/two-component sensor histidine kinase
MIFGAFQKQSICRRSVLFGWILLVLFLSLISKAERLPIKTYTVADGLLRDGVYRIRQDSRGFLWFCTSEGISRFDGYAFTNFTTEDGLPERHANDFLETKSGAIYVATDGGLARLNPKGLRGSPDNPLFTTRLPENPKAKSFRVLFEDASGTIWAGTSDGLYKLNSSDELEAVDLGKLLLPTANTLLVRTIIQDWRGALWIGTEANGLFRLSPSGEIRRLTHDDGLAGSSILSLLEDRSGRIWAGMRPNSYGSGLSLITPDANQNDKFAVRRYTSENGLPGSWVTALYQASDGKMWVATTGGLCLWQGDDSQTVCRTFTAKNDLCDADVWTITEDKDGNLWTGSRCGAKKLARYGFTTYTTEDGLRYNAADSIFENRDGELFVTFNGGAARYVHRFDGEKFTMVKPNIPPEVNYFGWGWSQTIWQDSRGAWLIPTAFGLFRFPDAIDFKDLARAAPQKFSPKTKGSEIFRTFEDSRGDIWIATTGAANELWRWERGTKLWRDYTAEVGFSKERIGTAFVEDAWGNLWIGTGEQDAALIRYRDDKFRIFTQAEGAPAGWTRDLYVDRQGRLWLANTADSLLRVDNPNAENLQFARYTTADGMSSASALCVTEDEFGRIYVGTPRGVNRLKPETGQIENFTTADGLPSSNVDVAYRDKNNQLWFATTGGVARFRPEPERARQPPNVLITGLRVNGVSQIVSILGESEIPELSLASDQQQLTIEFLGLGATLGEKLRYEYHLNNSDWTQTSERTLNFANLGNGENRLEIRAATADRIYSAKPASLSFKIAAPVWQRPWFVALAIALVSLTVFGVYRYRLNKLLEIERTRTRIASDLHDDIGTNLSKISLLSEIVNLQLANQNIESNRLLNSIAEISRESVGSMSDIVWAINPRRDSVLELVRRMRLHVEESFLEKGVRVRFNAPADGASIKLSMDVRRELYLIFKEAVSNAARHSDCKNVKVDFQLERRAIFLQIADDGKGFDASEKADGNGLENMRSRAAKNGGKFEVESETGRGTIVKIHFPQN